MALQVWLPLDKDTRNLGISPVIFTNSNVTFTIGKKLSELCATFNGSSSRLYTNNMLTGNQLSAACWVKYTASTSSIYYLISVSTSDGYAGQNIGLCIDSNNYKFLGNGDSSLTVAAPRDEWHHLCVTVNNNIITGYLDGISIGTAQKAAISKQSFINIGCRSANASNTNGQYWTNGQIQDVRIYDHCLSSKEVKEISRGLVLHFPLSDNSINFLPSTYQYTEYLQSTGTQYIDLGYIPKDNSGVEVQFMYDQKTSSYQGPFGTQSSSATADSFRMAGITSRDAWGMHTGDVGSTNGALYTTNTLYTVSMNKFGNYEIISNGSNILTAVSSSSNHYSNDVNSLYLFGRNTNSGLTHPFFGKIYYFKLYEDKQLIHYLVPCIRKSDNKPGMYDLISRVFYTNNGSGEFVVSTKVQDLPATYMPLQYLESTGTQYIQLNYTLSNNDDVEVDFEMTQKAPNRLLGARRTAGNSAYVLGMYDSSLDGRKYIAFGTDNWASQTEFKLNTRYTLAIKNATAQVDNVIKYTFSSSSFTTPNNICLFAYNDNGSISTNSYIKIYSCKIFQNHTLSHYYQPALRLSDGMAGMYDLITSTFYTSSSNTNFLYPSNENILWDTSGYCHNATIKNGQPIVGNISSPRYTNCTLFTNSSIIQAPLKCDTENISISYWMNWRTITSGYPYTVSFSDGGYGANQQIGSYVYGSKFYLCAHGAEQSTGVTCNINRWYHIAITVQGTTGKFYIDGELVYTGTLGSTQTGTRFTIGARSDGANSCKYPIDGYAVDVRCYASTLSASDVKELYETSMSVDASGNVLPRVLTS